MSQETEKILTKLNTCEHIFGTIFDSAAIGLALITLNYEWVQINPALTKLLGYSLDELSQKTFKDITHPDDLSVDLSELEALVAGEKSLYSHKKRYLHKDGHTIWIQLHVSVINDEHGKPLYFLSQVQDISKEHRIDEAKTEFVSLASHQLRTPLTAIGWYVQLLEDDHSEPLSESQQENITEISNSQRHALEMMKALLNVSRIELGTFMVDPKPLDLAQNASSVLQELRQQIEEKKLQIEEHYDHDIGIVEMDPNLVRIIFQNLLSNAVKYTPDEGSIQIRLGQTDNTITIQVTDSGYGIPQAEQSKVFQKLFRAENIIQKVKEGTGLGLYLVKKIVEEISQGTITFESEVDHGTTFTVELPRDGMRPRDGSKPLM